MNKKIKVIVYMKSYNINFTFINFAQAYSILNAQFANCRYQFITWEDYAKPVKLQGRAWPKRSDGVAQPTDNR